MTHARELLEIDPKLIFDLAARIKPPAQIAAEYELEPAYLENLINVPHVRKLVAQKQEELENAGFVLQTKAKWMLEDILGDMYKRAKKTDVALSSMLEFGKFLKDLAGMNKPEVTAGGEKFSIQIILGDSTPTKQPITINVEDVLPKEHIPQFIKESNTSNFDLSYDGE